MKCRLAGDRGGGDRTPLPLTVIALMLGVPPEDQMRFQHWSQAIALALEPTDLQPMATFVLANQATIEMSGWQSSSSPSLTDCSARSRTQR